MNQLTLSPSQARKIILHAAALSKQASFGRGPEAVYRLIDHLGFIQLDTNATVERAHHHIIATRIPGYKPEWLDELLEDERIYEFFSSDSGFMPMHHFRFSQPVKACFLDAQKSVTQPELYLMNRILDRITREGPLMVKDFENDRLESSSGWWDWRPAKIALERLYMNGKLMIRRTKNFLKIYDLPINRIPGDTDTSMPEPEEFARHVIRRELRSLGIAYAKEIAWRARFVKDNLVKKELERLVDEGQVCHVAIDGFKTSRLYMLPCYQHKKIELSDKAFILSPFDIVNVFRHRLRDFFDFDYQIECFVPKAKRIYGYFSLPVLLGETFVARMDSKADRKQKQLIIHNLHFEPVELNTQQLDKIIDAISVFAQFNQCQDVIVKASNEKKYLKQIRERLLQK